MATRNDVHQKFGETAETAQLLETELGNLLLLHECIDAGLLQTPDAERATGIYDRINRKTLGQLIRSLESAGNSVANLEDVLADALTARNRLTHSFYLQHNFRLNSDDGRDAMVRDLDSLQHQLMEAYKAVLLLSGVDLDRLVAEGPVGLPIGHLPIRT